MNVVASIPVSIGELIDKITILEIKLDHIVDTAKRQNIQMELDSLCSIRQGLIFAPAEVADKILGFESALKEVNQKIWIAEDRIRGLDRISDFGESFVTVARSIYRLNDARAATKREINLASGSAIVEEKGYEPY